MSKENTTESEKIKAFFLLCLKNWYLFIGFFFVCLIWGLIYYKTATPVFSIESKVYIAEDESLAGGGGSMSSSARSLASAFGVSSGGSGKMNIEDETDKLGSHGYIRDVVKNLELNKLYNKTEFFGFIKKPLYDMPPVKLETAPEMADTLSGFVIFSLDIKENGTEVTMKYNKVKVGSYTLSSFPVTIETPYGQFTFTEIPFMAKYKKPYSQEIVLTSYDYMAQIQMQQLSVDFTKKSSDIINLAMNYKKPSLAKKILTEVVAVYNEKWRENKAVTSDKTLKYLTERIEEVKSDLYFADTEIRSFKDKNNLTDIEADVTFYYKISGELQEKLIAAETQVKLVSIIDDFVRDENNRYELIPFGTITLEPAIAEVILEYNKALLDRNEQYKESNIITSTMTTKDALLEQQRKNLLRSLANIKQEMTVSLQELKGKEKQINSKISSLPKVEESFINLKREQEVQQAVYLFLKQKREETLIKAVSLMPKLKTIDNPYVINNLVSPNQKKIALLILFFGGFALPVGTIYAKPLVRQYFKNRKKK
jgi:uncharacterized protein involved in exopolysaccharide biosynthesis